MSMASVGAYSGRPPNSASADVAAEYWLDVDDWRPIQRFEGPPVGARSKRRDALWLPSLGTPRCPLWVISRHFSRNLPHRIALG